MLKLNGYPLPILDERPGGSSVRGPHRLGAFALCEQKGDYRYWQGIIPKQRSEMATLGSLLHLHQAYYWAAKAAATGACPVPGWFHQTSLDEELEKEARGFQHLITKAEAAMKSFRDQYAVDSWEPFAIEKEYTVSLVEIDPGCPEHLENEVVSVRLDLGARTTKNINVFVDYKTVASAYNSALPRWDPDGKFRVDFQIAIIERVLEIAAPELQVHGGVIQRILQVPPYLTDRHPVRTPPTFTRQALAEIVTECVRIEVDARERGHSRKTGLATGACHMAWSYSDNRHAPGRPCEYRDLCLAENPVEFEALKTAGFMKR